MFATERNDILRAFQLKANTILVGKGQDYSNEDVLSSFKEAATAAGMPPYRVAEVFIATKQARLRNLLKQQTRTPNYESIEDTIIDMYNYVFLLHLLIKEEQSYATSGTKDAKGKELTRVQRRPRKS